MRKKNIALFTRKEDGTYVPWASGECPHCQRQSQSREQERPTFLKVRTREWDIPLYRASSRDDPRLTAYSSSRSGFRLEVTQCGLSWRWELSRSNLPIGGGFRLTPQAAAQALEDFLLALVTDITQLWKGL